MIKGIDVAKWQGVIDWDKVKEDGVQFVILKATNKSNTVEDSFERNYKGATEQGIPVGVYNYSYATDVNKAYLDACAMINAIKGKSIKLKVWLDVEDSCQKGIGQKLIDIILMYKKTIESAGYEFGVYTGLSFYNSYIKPYASQIKCDFWIARYPSSKKMTLSENPSTAKKPNIRHNLWGWQYSSTGKIAGIKGNVDMNICYVADSEKIESTTEYFPAYTGNTGSFVAALNSLDITSSFSYRREIAKVNGITPYIGSAAANITMLTLLKQGMLKRP